MSTSIVDTNPDPMPYVVPDTRRSQPGCDPNFLTTHRRPEGSDFPDDSETATAK